jgi:hypothetical protein
MSVHGIDIASNAINPKLSDVFSQGCMWEEQNYKPTDVVTCIDVLEHLPTQHVETTLKLFKKYARKICFLSICLTDDILGPKLIGEQLHLTVKSPYWWIDKFKNVGFDIEFMLISQPYLDALLK